MYKCRQFFSWLQDNGLEIILPIRDQIIAAYLVNKMETAKSNNFITSSSAAIKWLHSLVNTKPNPVDSPIVQQIKGSARRQLHKPTNQKEPITLEQVNCMVDKLVGENRTLIDLRTAFSISLKFSLLFRHEEMSKLKACHLTELKDGKGMSIFIPQSKTDIFRDGSYAYISSTESRMSPISILKSYLSKCNIQIGQDAFIFTALSFHSSSQSYTPLLNRPLS